MKFVASLIYAFIIYKNNKKTRIADQSRRTDLSRNMIQTLPNETPIYEGGLKLL